MPRRSPVGTRADLQIRAERFKRQPLRQPRDAIQERHIMIKNLRAAVLAVGAITSIPAAGAPISVSQTFTFDRLISGASNAFSFDLASMLASAGLSASGVESGSLVVSGFSDPSYGSPATAYGSYQTVSTSTRTVTADYWVPPYTYSYRCGIFSYCYRTNPGYWRTDYYTVDDRHDERMVDIRHADTVADTLSVHVGDSTVSGVAASSLNVQNAYGQRTYEGNSCSYYDYYGNCSYTYYYSRQRDVYSAIYGAVNASLGLDGTALTALKNSGQLDLNLAMDIGQMTLQSIRFDLLLVDPSDSSTSVPAPGSLMLASSALVGFALANRRRRSTD